MQRDYSFEKYRIPYEERISPYDVMLSPGNVDIYNRPQNRLNDEDTATVYTAGYKDNHSPYVDILGVDYDTSKILSPAMMDMQYLLTGKNLGTFSSAQAAEDYAQKLHEMQADFYLNRKPTAQDIGLYFTR